MVCDGGDADWRMGRGEVLVLLRLRGLVLLVLPVIQGVCRKEEVIRGLASAIYIRQIMIHIACGVCVDGGVDVASSLVAAAITVTYISSQTHKN